ncbi:hypothetical protein ACVIGA_004063 [Bradyrhizobium sp. USDA 3240]
MMTQGTIGNVEFQSLGHDEDRDELAERGEPAQPQDRIQADIAAGLAEIGSEVGHLWTLAVPWAAHKFAT